jgi:signal transduction histidine kinase/ActR/RegA family two-component response regulator
MTRFLVGRSVSRSNSAALKRILLIGDGSASVESLHSSIQHAGYSAESASGPREALKAVSKNLFDVVFVDHSVPGLDLSALCRRARERNPNVFIVLAGERLDFPFLQDALTAQANEVLALPTDRQEVSQLVRRASSAEGPDTDQMTPTGLAVLQEFNLGINLCQTLEEMFGLVLEKCLAVLGAVSGSAFVFNRETDDLVLEVAEGPRSESLVGTRQKVGSGIAGLVAQSRQALLVTDIRSDPRFAPRDSERYQTGSFLCVPLVSQDQLVGVVCANDKRSGAPFTKTDIELVMLLAANAATVAARLQAHQSAVLANEQLKQEIGRLSGEFEETIEELTYLKDHNRNIIESISLGVAVFGFDLKINFCNGAFGALLGRKAADFLRMSVLDLGFRLAGGELEQAVLAVLRQGVAHRFEPVKWHGPAGKKTFKLDLSPFSASSGKVVGGVLVAEDITAHVELERELARSEEQAAVGRIAAGVAHELNNPLDGVLRFVNLSLGRLSSDSPVNEYLRTAREGLTRMADIIKALLSFSRKSTGADDRRVNVNDVIDEAVKAMAPIASAQQIEVELDLCQNGLMVRGGQLHQVVANLIKNAYDAMPNGGKLRISTVVSDERVEMIFADQGCGIASDVMDTIFEPFVTTKEIGKGVGLGLSICKRIIERYQGAIRVESTPGKGSTFTIELPLTSEFEAE